MFENVAFGLRRKKVSKGDVKTRVDEALRLVEMTGFENRKPGQMSGGQQQRVALARALVNRPKVLLLDEPLGALDLKLRKQMQLELKQIQQEVGITFIYVTHDQEEAMTMSDRLAVMRHGRIEQTGGPEEVYEHPATPFVASFLGASNLLLGEMKAESNGFTSILTEGGDVLRADTHAIPAGLAGPVQVGVRPEKITLVPQDESPPRTGTTCRASSVYLRTSGSTISTRWKVRAATCFACTCRTWAPRDRTRTRATRSASSGSRSTRSSSSARIASRRRVNERQASAVRGSRVDPRHDAAPDVAARPVPVRGGGRRGARHLVDPGCVRCER